MAEKNIKMVEVEELELFTLRSLILGNLAIAHAYRSEVDQYLSNGFFKNCCQRFISMAITKPVLVLLGLGMVGSLVSWLDAADRGLAFFAGMGMGALMTLVVVAIVSVASIVAKTKEKRTARVYYNYLCDTGWDHLHYLDYMLNIDQESSQAELSRRINKKHNSNPHNITTKRPP